MYSIHEIASILNKTAVIRTDSRISQLLTDSRKLILPDEALFFAIATQRNNGMNYIAELYQKGVRNFVISNPDFDTSPYSGANFLLVENTLKALQNLAAKHRRKFDIPVIGITGSNGKTVVKEWISQILENVRKVVKSPKSFNSQIGVPLSVWQLREDTEIGIFEAGISEVSEMSNLQTIIQPTIGIFTNIGQAHDENFIHREQKTGEKLNLFTHVDTLIYCLDHKEIHNKIMASGIGRNIKTFTWSVEKPEVDVFIKRIDKQKNTSGIDFIFKNQNYHIDIPFVDAASIENAVHCLCTLLHLGFDMDFIQEGVMQLHPIEMRLEQKEGINGCTIINDSYSSDLNSLTIALDFLNQQNQHAKKTVILSDIFQSGMLDSELYQKIAQLLKEKNIHRIIGIGEKISSFASVFQKEQEFYANTHDFIIHFQSHNFANECILLKGARVFEFEKIDKLLQQKTHETIMEINLDGIIHNLNYFKSQLRPNVKLMAMVKAFSYGSGSYEIGNVLQFHNVDYLTVAYTDEGIALRKAGIVLPIVIMNPELGNFSHIISHNLEAEIYSFRILHNLIQEIPNFDTQQEIPIHIKIDSGMHRLGFLEHELPELTALLKKYPQIKVKSIFSHLAGSDNTELDYFTKEQAARFEKMSASIQEAVGYKPLLHILNSAGISRFPQYQFDMVRLGLGLYGVGWSEQEQQKLKNVNTLKTVISQIKTIPKGESVGYNRNFMAVSEARIATIPIGYADGFNRKLGNGKGKVLINGQLASVIGNVCMDMSFVDVTHITAHENDEVIIFGEDYPVQNLAQILDTIPYEIFTGVSQRVKRVYYQE